MKRQHGRTGPFVVNAWTALWVGLLACFVVGLAAYLYGASQEDVVVQDINVSKTQVCPDKRQVNFGTVTDQVGLLTDDTKLFMELCGYNQILP